MSTVPVRVTCPTRPDFFLFFFFFPQPRRCLHSKQISASEYFTPRVKIKSRNRERVTAVFSCVFLRTIFYPSLSLFSRPPRFSRRSYPPKKLRIFPERVFLLAKGGRRVIFSSNAHRLFITSRRRVYEKILRRSLIFESSA